MSDYKRRMRRTICDQTAFQLGKFNPETAMARCDTCGNDYDKSFQVLHDGATHTFDSFECAVHKLAPRCGHCGCTILGHGVEAAGSIYCCAHCAGEMGADNLVDNAEHAQLH
jgi:hypothetical protein